MEEDKGDEGKGRCRKFGLSRGGRLPEGGATPERSAPERAAGRIQRNGSALPYPLPEGEGKEKQPFTGQEGIRSNLSQVEREKRQVVFITLSLRERVG